MLRHRAIVAMLLLPLLSGPLPATGQEAGPTALPTPQLEKVGPLMAALQARRTCRSFSDRPLPRQELANLLWAAFGVNRSRSGKRTAPSARNWQEIDIYIASASGLFRHDAIGHRLEPIRNKDLRALTGRQSFAADAPVTLIYVADLKKMTGAPQDRLDFYIGADTGFIAQNVYLYCAAAGLATGVRADIDRQALAKAMGLRPEQRITLAQSVGYRL